MRTGLLLLSALLIAVPLVAADSTTYCVKWRATSNSTRTACANHRTTSHAPRKSLPDSWASASVKAAAACAKWSATTTSSRVKKLACKTPLLTSAGFEHVTCGSSVKLVHGPSRYRMHSHEIQYGSGSGQQSATTHIACTRTCSRHLCRRRTWKSAPLGWLEKETAWIRGSSSVRRTNSAQQRDNAKTTDFGNVELIHLRHRSTNHLLSTSSKSRFNDNNCPQCLINAIRK
ncbi:hypothetical protein F442_22319 [Phytophthora nicotianae P10297]|uniref:Secreted protein n=1 Tax=Phytophthora nicotianae P10297 TaxID=1317064 RepID=W2Y0A0_PHYNI|nr:hypothetical protein F442_22319 [Phytophthora nicotianae P10297]